MNCWKTATEKNKEVERERMGRENREGKGKDSQGPLTVIKQKAESRWKLVVSPTSRFANVQFANVLNHSANMLVQFVRSVFGFLLV